MLVFQTAAIHQLWTSGWIGDNLPLDAFHGSSGHTAERWLLLLKKRQWQWKEQAKREESVIWKGKTNYFTNTCPARSHTSGNGKPALLSLSCKMRRNKYYFWEQPKWLPARNKTLSSDITFSFYSHFPAEKSTDFLPPKISTSSQIEIQGEKTHQRMFFWSMALIFAYSKMSLIGEWMFLIGEWSSYCANQMKTGLILLMMGRLPYRDINIPSMPKDVISLVFIDRQAFLLLNLAWFRVADISYT